MSHLSHISGASNFSSFTAPCKKSLLWFMDPEQVGVSFTRTACQWKASTTRQKKYCLSRFLVGGHSLSHTLSYVHWNSCSLISFFSLHNTTQALQSQIFFNTWLNLLECDFEWSVLQYSHFLLSETSALADRWLQISCPIMHVERRMCSSHNLRKIYNWK